MKRADSDLTSSQLTKEKQRIQWPLETLHNQRTNETQRIQRPLKTLRNQRTNETTQLTNQENTVV